MFKKVKRFSLIKLTEALYFAYEDESADYNIRLLFEIINYFPFETAYRFNDSPKDFSPKGNKREIRGKFLKGGSRSEDKKLFEIAFDFLKRNFSYVNNKGEIIKVDDKSMIRLYEVFKREREKFDNLFGEWRQLPRWVESVKIGMLFLYRTKNNEYGFLGATYNYERFYLSPERGYLMPIEFALKDSYIADIYNIKLEDTMREANPMIFVEDLKAKYIITGKYFQMVFDLLKKEELIFFEESDRILPSITPDTQFLIDEEGGFLYGLYEVPEIF